MNARLFAFARCARCALVAQVVACTDTDRAADVRDASSTAGTSAADGGAATSGAGGRASGGRSGGSGGASSSGGKSTGSGGKQNSAGGAADSSDTGDASAGGKANGGGGHAGAAGSSTGGSQSTDGGSLTYATDFSGDENPLSEGGVWFNQGLDWTSVQKKGGLAFGTLTGLGGYNDSYARLDGFPPNQEASAIIHYAPGSATDSACTHEVELLVRWSDAPHSARGYECNIGYSDAGTYAQIVRWEGAIGSFSPLSGGSPGQVKDGDEVRATAIGDVITVYYNGKQIVRLQDSMYPTGNPGIAFFRRDCGANENFAFTSFRASAL